MRPAVEGAGQRYRCQFIKAQDLFDEMYAPLADRSTRQLLKRLARLDVLLIDEFGYLSLKPENHHGDGSPRRPDAGGDAPVDSADGRSALEIRSLAYLLPVIEEVLELRVNLEYFEYLRYKLARVRSIR